MTDELQVRVARVPSIVPQAVIDRALERQARQRAMLEQLLEPEAIEQLDRAQARADFEFDRRVLGL